MTANTSTPRIGFRKILYLTDLSNEGRHAFPYAASLAHKYDADLTVLHIVERHDFEKYLVGYVDEDLWEQIKERNLEDAREMLIRRKRSDAAIRNAVDQFCQDAMEASDDGQPYVTYDVDVEEGDPVDTVLEKVRREGFDLVVVGKHGHGIIEGTLMGDTARRIVRRCTVPVLVVQLPANR
jgi:nucleotide-binding universal stress UspA family protein